MAPRTLIVDEFDLGEIGFIGNDEIRDTFGAPQREWNSSNIHGRVRSILVAPRPKYKERTAIVNGTVLADDRITLDAALDELKYRLYKPEIGIRFSHDETREYIARCDQISVDYLTPALVQRAAEVGMRFIVLDPRMRAISDTVVGFTTATAIPLGTALTRGVIRITGGTNPIVVYKNYAGTEIARMEFTWSGTWIDVDLYEQTIVDNAAANQATALTGGDFFDTDPVDGDFTASQWPTLEIASGGSSGSYTYRKMYW